MRAAFAILPIVLLAASAWAADADAIREFLAVPVEERLSSAIEAGDHRYLGVAGSSLQVPGVASGRLPPSAVLVIPGTSGGADPELSRAARDYAAQYNRLLVERLAKIGG